jgi:hypothetical protein
LKEDRKLRKEGWNVFRAILKAGTNCGFKQ